MTEISVRSILRENAWQLVMYVLGMALVGLWNWTLAPIYLLLCLLSNLIYMAKICPYCGHYGLRTCKAGFHILSGGRFKPQPGLTFANQFRSWVWVMFPGWFLPPLVGGILLAQHFSWGVLILLASFCVVGFWILPQDSKRHCDDCDMVECPRYSKRKMT
jgi:hypothetical protein